MTKITIPNWFRDGEVLQQAALDANFAAIASVLNGGITRDNFRANAGITNKHKASPFAWVPHIFSVPEIKQGPDSTQEFQAPLAFPHYGQLGGATNAASEGNIVAGCYAREPFFLHSIQGMFRSSSGVAAGDTIEANLRFRPYLAQTTATFTKNLKASLDMAGTLLETEPDSGEFPKVDNFALGVKVVTTADPGTRLIRNLTVVVWTKVPHSV